MQSFFRYTGRALPRHIIFCVKAADGEEGGGGQVDCCFAAPGAYRGCRLCSRTSTVRFSRYREKRLELLAVCRTLYRDIRVQFRRARANLGVPCRTVPYDFPCCFCTVV